MSKQAGNVTQDDFGKQNKQQVPEAEVARILPGAQPRRARDEHQLGTAPAPSCPFAFPFPSQEGAFSFKKPLKLSTSLIISQGRKRTGCAHFQLLLQKTQKTRKSVICFGSKPSCIRSPGTSGQARLKGTEKGGQKGRWGEGEG